MKYFSKLLGSAVFSALLIGAPLLAQDVNVDYDHTADFKRMTTYSWQKIHATDPQVEERISAAVNRNLVNLGFNTVDKNPDLLITVVDVTKNPREYGSFYASLKGFNWRRGWGSKGFSDTARTVQQIPLGTLVFDLYDGKTHQLLWRATVDEAVAKSSDKNSLVLDKVIGEMLDQFPKNEK